MKLLEFAVTIILLTYFHNVPLKVLCEEDDELCNAKEWYIDMMADGAFMTTNEDALKIQVKMRKLVSKKGPLMLPCGLLDSYQEKLLGEKSEQEEKEATGDEEAAEADGTEKVEGAGEKTEQPEEPAEEVAEEGGGAPATDENDNEQREGAEENTDEPEELQQELQPDAESANETAEGEGVEQVNATEDAAQEQPDDVEKTAEDEDSGTQETDADDAVQTEETGTAEDDSQVAEVQADAVQQDASTEDQAAADVDSQEGVQTEGTDSVEGTDITDSIPAKETSEDEVTKKEDPDATEDEVVHDDQAVQIGSQEIERSDQPEDIEDTVDVGVESGGFPDYHARSVLLVTTPVPAGAYSVPVCGKFENFSLKLPMMMVMTQNTSEIAQDTLSFKKIDPCQQIKNKSNYMCQYYSLCRSMSPLWSYSNEPVADVTKTVESGEDRSTLNVQTVTSSTDDVAEQDVHKNLVPDRHITEPKDSEADKLAEPKESEWDKPVIEPTVSEPDKKVEQQPTASQKEETSHKPVTPDQDERSEPKDKSKSQMEDSEDRDAVETKEELLLKKKEQYAEKLQEIELTVLKLENKFLKQSVDEKDSSLAFKGLEDQIGSLEREILLLNQSIHVLNKENEELKQFKEKHTSTKVVDESRSSELINASVVMRQHSKIVEMADMAGRQSDSISHIENKMRRLEDQNRYLFEALLNQSQVMNSVLSKFSEIQEKRDEKNLLTMITEVVTTLTRDATNTEPPDGWGWQKEGDAEAEKDDEDVAKTNVDVPDAHDGYPSGEDLEEGKIHAKDGPTTVDVENRKIGKKSATQKVKAPVKTKAKPVAPKGKKAPPPPVKTKAKAPAKKVPTPKATGKAGPPTQKAKAVPKKKVVAPVKKTSTAKAKTTTTKTTKQATGGGKQTKTATGKAAPKKVQTPPKGKVVPTKKVPVTAKTKKVATGQQAKVKATGTPTPAAKKVAPQQKGKATGTTAKATKKVAPKQKAQVKQPVAKQKVVPKAKAGAKQPVKKKTVPKQPAPQKGKAVPKKQPPKAPAKKVAPVKKGQPTKAPPTKAPTKKAPTKQAATNKVKQGAAKQPVKKTGEKKPPPKVPVKTPEAKKPPVKRQPVKREPVKREPAPTKKAETKQPVKSKNTPKKPEPSKDSREDPKKAPPHKVEPEQRFGAGGRHHPAVPRYVASDSSQPLDCYDLLMAGKKRDMVLKIRPAGMAEEIKVFCDMSNGGWTVIQRRSDEVENFERSWDEYKTGFGVLYNDHWLGNELIHRITNQGNYTLKIDMHDWERNKATVTYDFFALGDESDGYRLHINGYSGEVKIGDSLSQHHNFKFSTHDRDHDLAQVEFQGNCAKRFRGAWWYHKCYNSNLNGHFYKGGTIVPGRFDGIIWKSWKGNTYGLKKVEMKVKRLMN